MSRLRPLPIEDTGDLAETLMRMQRGFGFTPNSLLIMARKPAIVRGFMALFSAVFRESNEVSPELKALVSHIASRASGCRYCWAHTAASTLAAGAPADKLEAVFNFETSPLFTEAERAALHVAAAAAITPNGVTDGDIAHLLEHFSEGQVVEIIAVIATFGFLNRWNDTMATELEEHPLTVGRDHLVQGGWDAGKHAPAD